MIVSTIMLYEYCPGADLKGIAEFDRLRENGAANAMKKKMERLRLRFIAKNDPAFPEEFLELKDVPARIYVRGTLSPPEAKRVSVIGSCRCSEYGKECAFSSAGSLQRREWRLSPA